VVGRAEELPYEYLLSRYAGLEQSLEGFFLNDEGMRRWFTPRGLQRRVGEAYNTAQKGMKWFKNLKKR
jgi:hypothetical protein